MKKDGVLIELDPSKKYSYFVNPNKVNIEDLMSAGKTDSIVRVSDMSSFKIVEFTDNIVGFIQKFDNTGDKVGQ
jgi:hypothetical protein